MELGAITDYGQKKYGDKPRYDKPKFDSSKVKCYNCNKLGHISRQVHGAQEETTTPVPRQ